MRWMKSILVEIFGLFVEDGIFALAIIVCLAVVRLLLTRLHLPAVWGGIVLFAGLALILLESAVRRSGR